MRLIATVGLPRSGKSTWAHASNYPVVCPDAVRFALHGTPFNRNAETMTWAIVEYMIQALFFAGHDTVVLDATNITMRQRRRWRENRPWLTRYVYFDTPVEMCVQRALDNGDERLAHVIRDMHDRFEPLTDDETLLQTIKPETPIAPTA